MWFIACYGISDGIGLGETEDEFPGSFRAPLLQPALDGAQTAFTSVGEVGGVFPLKSDEECLAVLIRILIQPSADLRPYSFERIIARAPSARRCLSSAN